jgi:hypothetical protein
MFIYNQFAEILHPTKESINTTKLHIGLIQNVLKKDYNCFVKKVFILLFVQLYLLSATDLGQLVKLPFVWEHYQMHQSIEPTVTFLEFITSHYLESDSQAPDKNQHQHLPFKSINTHFMQVVADMHQPTVIVKSLLDFNSLSTSFPKVVFHLNELTYTIWQPPKLVS